MSQLGLDLPGQRIDLCDPIHLIPEKFNPVGVSGRISRVNLQHITTDTEAAAFEVHVVSRILNVNQLMNNLVPILYHTRTE